MQRHRTVLYALLLLLIIGVQDSQADELRDRMMRLAEQLLATTQQQPVKIGVFSPTGLEHTNAGPGFEGILKQCLNKLQPGSVQPDAKFEIKGDYAFAKPRQQPELTRVVKVNARIIDLEYGEELGRAPLNMELDHTKSIAAILQECIALPVDGSKAERNRVLAEALDRPTTFVHPQSPSIVSSHPESPFGLEILVKPYGRDLNSPAMPRPAYVEQGRAFVDIDYNEIYEIKAYNNTDYEVAVRLFIDGLDVYHFSMDRNAEGNPRFTHTVIQPHSSATIVGWHQSVAGDLNYRSFLVTSYGLGAVSQARIPSRGDVGIIHAQFSFSRPLPPGVRAAGGKETGFGPPITRQQSPVRREIDPPHDFVSIRYDREPQPFVSDGQPEQPPHLPFPNPPRPQ